MGQILCLLCRQYGFSNVKIPALYVKSETLLLSFDHSRVVAFFVCPVISEHTEYALIKCYTDTHCPTETENPCGLIFARLCLFSV